MKKKRHRQIAVALLLFMGKLLCCQILYLVDDVLILALGLEVELDAANSTDDASYAAAPEETVGKVVVL